MKKNKLFYWVNVTIPGEWGFLSYQKLRVNHSVLDRYVLILTVCIVTAFFIGLVYAASVWLHTLITTAP